MKNDTTNEITNEKIDAIKAKSLEIGVPIITDETREVLAETLEKIKPLKILEIGGGIGYSGAVILSSCTAHLTTIEIDADRFKLLKANLPNAKVIFGDALDEMQRLISVGEKFDFIFLDGAKAQYNNYFPFIDALLLPTGVLFADNIDFHGMASGELTPTKGAKTIIKGLQNFKENLIKNANYKTQYIKKGDGILIARKKVLGVELLAPAGNYARFKTALHFGADAVYMGGKQFGLRAGGDNFTESELKKAVNEAHKLGKKVYITVNIFARNADFYDIKQYLINLDKIGVDAIIVSDLGVLRLAKQLTNLEVHISTQANVLNKYTAETYANLGATRIVLARECSLAEIKEICDYLKGRCEIEVFIQGAMCVSYSGRCLLSNYICSRESNRGMCAQPCRFSYTIKTADAEMPIEEDERGTYILNSRDLCLAHYIGQLAEAGVKSFKIEGRNKSENYVAGAVGAYRRIMNGEIVDADAELSKISHRPYTTGFAFNDDNKQFIETAGATSTHDIVASILKTTQDIATVVHKNKFSVGDTLEILSPTEAHGKSFIVEKIINELGEQVDCAKKVKEVVKINCPFKLKKGDILIRATEPK
ncbi:MAG: U32 family peptidase C-terminal domain-containing protein [Christensenellaceae bacterium]|jgi:putative protease|nr:U32 family peptidase C-terminal domain-containing protein [Christensenellaceae bacterium]